jgi:hypothetical protein
MIAARMQLVQAGGFKVLAGIDNADDERCFVLRKQDDGTYALHQVPLDADLVALRSILSADQSEAGELVNAVIQTMKQPPKRRRKRAKRATKKASAKPSKRRQKLK